MKLKSWIRNPSNLSRLAVLISSLLFLAIFYNNCAKGFQTTLPASGDFSSENPDGFNPDFISDIPQSVFVSARTAGVTEPNCLAGTGNHDACLFWKNPVAQRGSAYAAITGFGPYLQFGRDVTSDQTFGVRLSGSTVPNRLENDRIYVFSSTMGQDYFDVDPYSSTAVESRIRTKPSVTLENNRFVRSYASDGNSVATNKATAQLMAYFWLNHQEEQIKRRTGYTWLETQNKKVFVDAYAVGLNGTIYPSLVTNAYFTYDYNPTTQTMNRGYIVMGGSFFYDPAQNANVLRHEMAMSSEIYLHEMGHANITAAMGPQALMDPQNVRYPLYIDRCDGSPSLNGTRENFTSYQAEQVREQQLANLCGANAVFYSASLCASARGCLDAINEGQADFHYLMIFPESPALAETITNNVDGGLGSPAANGTTGGQCNNQTVSSPISRNVNVNISRNAQFFYDNSIVQNSFCTINDKGEIHGMGSAYATILWQIYSQTVFKRSFEQAFQEHLRLLSQSDTFVTAREDLISADQLVCGGCNRDLILSVFGQKLQGVQ